MAAATPLLFSSGVALAAIGGSATPLGPGGVGQVGDQDVALRLVLRPSLDTDQFPATVDVGSIKLTPTCATTASPWDCASPNPGVFSIVDTTAVPGGGGGANEVCGGITFDFGAPDAANEIAITASGVITFTGNLSLCTINLQVDIDNPPTDVDPVTPGLQTVAGGQFNLTGPGGAGAEKGAGQGSNTFTIVDCAVEVDKQVSCDGGATWVDDDLVVNNEDGTNSCNGISTDNILVRYAATNPKSDCQLEGCTWTESNSEFGNPPGPFDLDNGETRGPGDQASAMCAEAYGDPQNPNEPDSIDIECDTEYEGVSVEASDTASFACLDVSLKVDRNVACDGNPADDMALVTGDEDGTNGCTTLDGNDVNWGYQSCNDGDVALYDCTLVDKNVTVSAPVVVGNLASDPTCAAPVASAATNNPVVCSTELEGSEAINGEVTLTCCTQDVAGIENCAEGNRVSVFDRSDVTCQTQSTLEIVKECVDEDVDGTDDGVRVTVNATSGDLGFTSCEVTDTIHEDDPSCPPVGPGTPVVLSNASYDLAPGGEEVSTGDLPDLAADACNVASVSCLDAQEETVTENAAPVVCNAPAEGCITRTPGFWGNRPDTADDYTPVSICGLDLASVAANEESTTEAMCSVGKDGKILGSQRTQLIRQCTAAALNLAVTEAEEGGCEESDEANFAACCGAAETAGYICSAEDEGGLSVESCIGLLDEFNNSLDTLQSDVFSGLGAAQPGECKDSRNNGYHPHAGALPVAAPSGPGKKK